MAAVPREPEAPRRSVARWVAASLTVFLPLLGVLGVPAPAQADGPTTFSNTAAIDIPAAASASQIGPASPYPSAITVSGLAGAVTKVQVVFHNLTHGALGDVDAMVVAPTGANLVVLSDVDQPSGTLTFANNATFTFDDAGGSMPTLGVPSGTYHPVNNGGAESFPAPAPAPSAQTTLAGAFTGISPNGTWQLYIVDDATGDLGQMAGGWSLVITTETAAVATTTAVTTSGTPSTTGTAVSFTATVTAGGNAVTAGTVAFTDNGTPLGAPVPVDAAGAATLTTSALTEGTHVIVGTYSGSTGFLTSNGSVSQRVDNQTTVTGSTYCNTGPLTVPAVGPSAPYPSNITVSGLTAPVATVTATLNGVSHQVPVDFDVMLSGPVPTTNLLLMSDVGGTAAVSGANVTFDDAAPAGVPTPLVSGTFRPTDDDTQAVDAAFPAPAPAFSGATTLSTFNGASGNGVWSLWVVDDAPGDAGSITGGWCLTITTVSATTTTSLTSSANPSTFGQTVTFTATVTAGGSPAAGGTIAFADGGTALASVPVDAAGTATLTTSALSAGTHTITATYSGAAGLGTSSASLDQVVLAPVVADAGGPYALTEGDSLSLDGSGSTALATYAWDLDGDGDFTDAGGVAPTLTWAQLEAFGIDDGPSTHTVALTVTLGAQVATATAVLAVANAAPTTVVEGSLTATTGVPFTIKVGADDPSSADMAAQFTYVVDWGDGSPVTMGTGPADPPFTHTYSAAGTYTASLTSTDKDGGTSDPLTIEVLAVAPTPTPTPTPITTPAPRAPGTPAGTGAGASLPATGADSGVAAWTAGILVLLGAGLAAAGHRRSRRS